MRKFGGKAWGGRKGGERDDQEKERQQQQLFGAGESCAPSHAEVAPSAADRGGVEQQAHNKKKVTAAGVITVMSPDVGCSSRPGGGGGYVEVTFISAKGLKDVMQQPRMRFGGTSAGGCMMSPYATAWLDPRYKLCTTVASNAGPSPLWSGEGCCLRVPLPPAPHPRGMEQQQQQHPAADHTARDRHDIASGGVQLQCPTAAGSSSGLILTVEVWNSDTLLGSAKVNLSHVFPSLQHRVQACSMNAPPALMSSKAGGGNVQRAEEGQYMECQLYRPSGRAQGLLNLQLRLPPQYSLVTSPRQLEVNKSNNSAASSTLGLNGADGMMTCQPNTFCEPNKMSKKKKKMKPPPPPTTTAMQSRDSWQFLASMDVVRAAAAASDQDQTVTDRAPDLLDFKAKGPAAAVSIMREGAASIANDMDHTRRSSSSSSVVQGEPGTATSHPHSVPPPPLPPWISDHRNHHHDYSTSAMSGIKKKNPIATCAIQNPPSPTGAYYYSTTTTSAVAAPGVQSSDSSSSTATGSGAGLDVMLGNFDGGGGGSGAMLALMSQSMGYGNGSNTSSGE